jgi:hypothetical protein
MIGCLQVLIFLQMIRLNLGGRKAPSKARTMRRQIYPNRERILFNHLYPSILSPTQVWVLTVRHHQVLLPLQMGISKLARKQRLSMVRITPEYSLQATYGFGKTGPGTSSFNPQNDFGISISDRPCEFTSAKLCCRNE